MQSEYLTFISYPYVSVMCYLFPVAHNFIRPLNNRRLDRTGIDYLLASDVAEFIPNDIKWLLVSKTTIEFLF